MTTCGARFAIRPFFRAAAVQISRVSTRPEDDEFELTRQEGCETWEGQGLQTQSGTILSTLSRTRHENMSCKLHERGIEPGDSRMLSEIFDQANSGDTVQWQVFEDSMVP